LGYATVEEEAGSSGEGVGLAVVREMIRSIAPPADAPFRRLCSRRLCRRSAQAARRRSTSRWRRPQTAERARVPPLRNGP